MEENNNIPVGWHLKQVVEFASKMQSGGTPKSDNLEYYNGEIPFVAIDDLSKSNKYISKTQKKITNKGLVNSSAWLVPKYSLLYSIYATLGVPRINLIEVATNQAILNIIPNKKIISLEFLYYLLLEKRNTILSHSAHTTQSNLNAKIVKELEFVFPKSTIEQDKIAEILSKVDKAISKTEEIIAKNNLIKTGLMQELLTKGINRDCKNFVQTDLKNLKVNSDFNITKLKSITKVRQGYQIEISLRKKEEGENRYVYITVQYLNNPLKYLEYIDNPPLEVISKYDDILFTRTGNTGQLVTNIVGVYHNNFFKVDFDKEIITKDYLLLFLGWKPVQDLILELAGTTTIPDLKHRDFYSIPIFFPKDLKEQNEITKIISSSDNVINDYTIELNKLKSIKTGLMQDLLSGKKRVTHLIN